MLLLIVLLSCLVSILMITLLNITSINSQIILFLLVLITLILFKIVFSEMIMSNNNNPISKNIMNREVDLNNKSLNVLPSNYNDHINKNAPVTNTAVNTNAVANNVAVNNVAVNNLAANNVSANNVAANNNNQASDNACLLEDCGCAQLGNKVCSRAADSEENPACDACSTTKFLNGEPTNSECIKNNSLNYGDMLNKDLPKASDELYGQVFLPQPGNNDCALDNSCLVEKDQANLHEKPKFYPGDPEFTEQKDFWKINKNNSDLCYIKPVLPEYFCKQ